VLIYSEILPFPKIFKVVPDVDSCIVIDIILLTIPLFKAELEGRPPAFISSGLNKKIKGRIRT
jgi:hypothetical protein